jgi:hypothetical protein
MAGTGHSDMTHFVVFHVQGAVAEAEKDALYRSQVCMYLIRKVLGALDTGVKRS